MQYLEKTVPGQSAVFKVALEDVAEAERLTRIGYREISESECHELSTAPEPDTITQTQIALAELAEAEAAHDLENKLAIAELAEMMGGTSNG